MKNVNVGDSHQAIKQTRSLLPWRVLYLSYPRETAEYSSLGVRWTSYGKIKLPTFFIQKRKLEKPTQRVNYDLLCEELEATLNAQEAEGYALNSMHPTHSGSYAVSTTPKQPHAHFLRTRPPSHRLQGEEALILIFKKDAIS